LYGVAHDGIIPQCAEPAQTALLKQVRSLLVCADVLVRHIPPHVRRGDRSQRHLYMYSRLIMKSGSCGYSQDANRRCNVACLTTAKFAVVHRFVPLAVLTRQFDPSLRPGLSKI
jgi:hypothetical protein